MATTLSINLPIAMPFSSSPTSAPRASRFTEGSPLTGSEVLSNDTSSAVFLTSILSQMDEHERRRARSHRNSNSSTDSFNSASSSNSLSRSSQLFGAITNKENRRSVVFSKRSVELVRQSFDDMRSASNIMAAEEKAKGFKGRLRALTGGREPSRRDSVKAYTGT